MYGLGAINVDDILNKIQAGLDTARRVKGGVEDVSSGRSRVAIVPTTQTVLSSPWLWVGVAALGTVAVLSLGRRRR